MKIIVSIDSNDPRFLDVQTYDDEGKPLGADLEVRDYGRGDEVDDSGNLYERVSA